MKINTGMPLSTTGTYLWGFLLKNMLRTSLSQKIRKLKNSQLQTKFIGSYKKGCSD